MTGKSSQARDENGNVVSTSMVEEQVSITYLPCKRIETVLTTTTVTKEAPKPVVALIEEAPKMIVGLDKETLDEIHKETAAKTEVKEVVAVEKEVVVKPVEKKVVNKTEDLTQEEIKEVVKTVE